MNKILGTTGYEQVIDAFVDSSLQLDFDDINRDFLDYLPALPARILDAGAGVGQNAATLAQRGYNVVAVEPLTAFLDIAKSTHHGLNISWVEDSLPHLKKLTSDKTTFDFILMDGVWHHLNSSERRACIIRCHQLLNVGGVCATSLRNGPAGAGKHIFPCHPQELIEYANEFGFEVLCQLDNQPSKMPHKQNVIWSRIALKKSKRHTSQGLEHSRLLP